MGVVTRSPTKNPQSVDPKNIDCWCARADHGAMVQCFVCSRFQHYECVGLSLDDLSSVISLENDGLLICKTCAPLFTTDKRSEILQDLPSAQFFVYRDPGSNSPLVFDSQVTTPPPPGSGTVLSLELIDRITTIAVAAASKCAETFFEKFMVDHQKKTTALIENILEKRDKKRNLVVVGLPENAASKSDQGKVDLAKIHMYCDKLDIERSAIRTVFRDGPSDHSKRILKVCFQEGHSADRMSFLRQSREIISRDSDFSHSRRKPFVRFDLTFEERERDRSLRAQVKALRDDGQDVFIRKGTIIHRSRYASADREDPQTRRPSVSSEEGN